MNNLCIGILFCTIFFSGCQTSGEKVHMMGQEKQKQNYLHKILTKKDVKPQQNIAIKKLELQTKKEIAKIDMQKALAVEKIRSEAINKKTNAQKEIALEKTNLQKEDINYKNYFNMWILFIVSIFISILLYLLYKMFHKHQENKLAMQKMQMEHEKDIKEKELQAKLIEKTVDIINSGKLSEKHQKILLESLTHKNKLIQ